MSRRICIVIISILSAVDVFSQHTVSGFVTDRRDSLLSDVLVFIPEFHNSCATKEGGTFILRNVNTGVVNIIFSKKGFQTVVKTIDTKDSATVVLVVMVKSSFKPEEIIHTTFSSRLSENLPYAVDAFSADELRRADATSFSASLAYQPGIDRITNGNSISQPVIRGMSTNRIAIFQNGIRIDNQLWDMYSDIGMCENGIGKVQVIKGPSALMYCADAIGGAIIYTDDKAVPYGTVRGDVRLGFNTSSLGGKTEIGIEGNTKGIIYSLRCGAESNASYIQGTGETVELNTEARNYAPNSKSKNGNGKAMFGLNKKWGVSKISYSYSNQQCGLIDTMADHNLAPSELNDKESERSIAPPDVKFTSQIFSSENFISLGKGRIDATLAYQMNERTEEDTTATNSIYTLKSNNITYNISVTSNPLKKYGFTIGTQGLMQKNENNFYLKAYDLNLLSGFALLRYDLEKWNFMGGARVDSKKIKSESDSIPNIEKYFMPVSFSAGAAFHALKNFTLKLNVASGEHAPSANEMLPVSFFSSYSLTNTNLVSEKSLQEDFGISFRNKDFDASVSVFNNQLKNYIYIKPSLDSLDRNTLRYMQDNATLTGAEIIADIHPQQIRLLNLILSYSYLHAKFDNGGVVPFIPANKLSAEIKLQSKSLDYVRFPYLSFVVTNCSEQKDTLMYERSTESYTLLDMKIGGTLRSGEQFIHIDISVNNLLNTLYYSHLSMLKDKLIRNAGRNISINVHIPFGIKGKS